MRTGGEILAGTLQAASKTNGHISTAKQSIDTLNDVNLDDRQTDDRSQLRILNGKNTLNEFNMNDIMMDEIIGEDKTEELNAVIEDAISISTNVVEEIDEAELSRLRLRFETQLSDEQHDSELEPSSGRVEEHARSPSTNSSLEIPTTSKVDNDVTIDESKQSSTEAIEKEVESRRESKTNLVESREETVNENITDVEKNTTEIPKLSTSTKNKAASNSFDLDEDARKSIGPSSTVTTMDEEDTTESADEIMIDDVSPTTPKSSFNPSSVPTKSMMYADTSSDENSSDENENHHEFLSSIQRSQKIPNIQKILHDLSDSRLDSDLSNSDHLRINTINFTNSNDDNQNSNGKNEENMTRGTKKLPENGNNTTTNHSSLMMNKMNSDGKEAITDEEFSEKLI
ncbi:hypothetical protein DICVIV_01689 [Dictyocaulus viviparus]|uniref:Uncharacterized protein n=1 Tax=Dictyocaulus viviparus TaxID=29172 RepID=A0A0D8Y5T6_DICVI|nr:hypothetical protein DICVIV_01689 [Dictyocaulus viviparus]